MIQWVKNNDAIGTVNRGVPCESGLCTLCDSACKGKCETWLSSLKGRKLLYPRNFGQTTSGSWLVSTVGVGYHSLRIQGYAYGAKGIAPPMSNNPDDCLFTNADVSTAFGNKEKTKCRVPIMTGALGSTFIARNYWESLPPAVKELGKYPEEIFAGWEPIMEKVGKDEMKNIPFGAVAMFAYADKLACGLQQFMAGARKFNLGEISRYDLMSANRETADVTGIAFMTDAQNEEALKVLNG